MHGNGSGKGSGKGASGKSGSDQGGSVTAGGFGDIFGMGKSNV
jgi:hypothetical protein